jgi:protein-ribulosamine 3-kinase
MTSWADIADAITTATGKPFKIEHRASLGGGCINSAFRIEGSGGRYFVKLNTADKEEMFAAEAAGLTEIARTGAIRVPRPVCHGAGRGSSWLVLEFIALRSAGHGGMRALGEQFAALHRTHAGRFGWHRDNTIGDTPQRNAWSDDWVAFWREHRLGYQLRLAARNGYAGRLQRDGERLMETLPAFFGIYLPQPALLHGDLWSGNAAFSDNGEPVIFDPAVYYGDREADLAMTELFGGFSAEFYAAYRDAFPLDAGYAVRKDLYNLYHVLNHLNLFGGGYLAQAEHLIGSLLSAA